MTRGYRITPRAAADIDAIASYTLAQWGAEQMADYLRSLTARFEWLAENPLAGRERDDIHPGYRSFPQGSHVVFYVIAGEHIDVFGVTHKSMDVGNALI